MERVDIKLKVRFYIEPDNYLIRKFYGHLCSDNVRIIQQLTHLIAGGVLGKIPLLKQLE